VFERINFLRLLVGKACNIRACLKSTLIKKRQLDEQPQALEDKIYKMLQHPSPWTRPRCHSAVRKNSLLKQINSNIAKACADTGGCETINLKLRDDSFVQLDDQLRDFALTYKSDKVDHVKSWVDVGGYNAMHKVGFLGLPKASWKKDFCHVHVHPSYPKMKYICYTHCIAQSFALYELERNHGLDD
jgi:hypothetical protein